MASGVSVAGSGKNGCVSVQTNISSRACNPCISVMYWHSLFDTTPGCSLMQVSASSAFRKSHKKRSGYGSVSVGTSLSKAHHMAATVADRTAEEIPRGGGEVEVLLELLQRKNSVLERVQRTAAEREEYWKGVAEKAEQNAQHVSRQAEEITNRVSKLQSLSNDFSVDLELENRQLKAQIGSLSDAQKLSDENKILREKNAELEKKLLQFEMAARNQEANALTVDPEFDGTRTPSPSLHSKVARAVPEYRHNEKEVQSLRGRVAELEEELKDARKAADGAHTELSHVKVQLQEQSRMNDNFRKSMSSGEQTLAGRLHQAERELSAVRVRNEQLMSINAQYFKVLQALQAAEQALQEKERTVLALQQKCDEFSRKH